MSKYLRISDGRGTNENDPIRGVWYSAACGYWTDDWDKVVIAMNSIPCCPTCRCPGFQTEYAQWIAGAMKHELNGHSGYVEFLGGQKETCGGRGFSFKEAYREWIEKGDQNEPNP